MKVIRSKVIGYCFGVARSIENAATCLEKAKEQGCPCYSLGNLIHNGDVVEAFRKQGLVSIKTSDGLEPGIAIVRAHGLPDAVKRDYREKGFEVFDSTCPIVAKGASLLRGAAQKGKRLIVLGVAGHAETIGLCGVETEPGKVIDAQLVCSLSDAHRLVEQGIYASDDDIVVVTQTTFNEREFQEIRTYLKSVFSKIRFSNSPCGAPALRNKAAKELAKQCDVVVVVGGKHSENTKVLAENIQAMGKPVVLIQNTKDLDEDTLRMLSAFRCVGICSGSSTPGTIIRAVEEMLEAI